MDVDTEDEDKEEIWTEGAFVSFPSPTQPWLSFRSPLSIALAVPLSSSASPSACVRASAFFLLYRGVRSVRRKEGRPKGDDKEASEGEEDEVVFEGAIKFS